MARILRLSIAAGLVAGSALFGINASAAQGPTGNGNGAKCVAFPNDNGTYTVEFITPSGQIQQRFDASKPPSGCEVVI
jgi:hypothetical protein